MKRLWFVLASAAVLAAACDGGDGGPDAEEVRVLSGVDRAAADPAADPRLAGEAITTFGVDLFGAVRALPTSAGENVVISPASVAIALAMVEPGATDAGRAALREVLRIKDPEAFHASMNTLEQALEARAPIPAHNEGEDPGELTVNIANAAFLQRGFPFRQAYIDAVTATYGPALHEVDFSRDPDAVARQINDFVATETRDRIVDLVADGVLDKATVFALVNALYLKASWLEVFDPDATRTKPFTRLDGSEVTVPLMRGTSDSSARGNSWVGATKSYVGGLAAQFILPDHGRFDEVAADLAHVFADYHERRTAGAELVVPRSESRFHVELADALRHLGLGPLFGQPGQLLGIAPVEKLVLDRAIHETFLALDEDGTEAAAATVLTGTVVSGPLRSPVPVILDRPFLFRIIDTETNTTLFLGQILDPT